MTPAARGLTRLWRLPARSARGDGLAARILAARGLEAPDAVDEFLHPTLRRLHEPSLIPDLDRAAERLLGGLASGRPLVIYGDYDVDGISATAILYHTLKALHPGADVRTYIPHRIDEGYGLNRAALLKMASEGVGLVVSVDCGVTAHGPARAAAEAGLDLIITDHHNPPRRLEDLPPAYAVVHPRRPDSAYPFGELCGAGVAYKLAWRLATMHCRTERVSPELRTLLVDLLAYAALGTVADVVPLVGENRVLAKFGLSRIKHSPLTGLRALVEACGLGREEIDAEHVGFWLGPRLNACGRMGHAREAVELLTTATGQRTVELARYLSERNEERKAIERAVTEEAAAMAEQRGMTSPDRRAIVLAAEHWHPGVLGIGASRLVDRFGRPAILMRRAGGECHGSGRSIDGFSLHAALERCAEHLTAFGGHDMAAGVRVSTERFDAFVEAFTREANERIPPERLTPSLSIDCEARLDELTPEAVADVERLAPFGAGHPRPKILLRGLRLDRRAEPFGRGGRHLSLHVRQAGPPAGSSPPTTPAPRTSASPALGRVLRLIAWNWGERWASLPAATAIDAVVVPRRRWWQNQPFVEPELLDLRAAASD